MEIESLKNQIFNREKAFGSEDIVRAHHVLMKEYGWIPLEEFKSIPLPTLWNLLSEIEKDRQAEQREMDKLKHK